MEENPKSSPWWLWPLLITIGAVAYGGLRLLQHVAATFSSWAAEAPAEGAIVLVLVIAGGIGAVVVVLWLVGHLVHDDTGAEVIDARRFPAAYRSPDVEGQRLFIGWSRGRWGSEMTWGRPTDSMCAIARAASGKTEGLAIPQALLWQGPAVLASTKPDVLRKTIARRRQLGAVHVWCPTAGDQVEGMTPTSANLLAGCQSPMVAAMRATSFIEATQAGGKDLPDSGFWVDQAGELLSNLFHAAAITGLTLAHVRDWLTSGDLSEAIANLEAGRETAWAAELAGTAKLPERTRAGIMVTAVTALKAARVSTVMERCCRPDFDIDRFLLGNETLYIAGSLEHQREVAPLTVLLVEAVAARTMELHQQGQLPRRVLVSLDELPAIAPLPKLRTFLSQGPQQGLTFAWFAQNWALLEEVFGQAGAQAIFEGTPIKVIFGGSTDPDFLELVSTVVGRREVEREAHSSDGRTTTTQHKEELLTAAEISHLPPHRALVLLPQPHIITTRRLEDVPLFRHATAGARVAQAAPPARGLWARIADALLRRSPAPAPEGAVMSEIHEEVVD